MAYENEDSYHGTRFLLDAKNSRQYGLRYDHGKVAKPVHVFAEDEREAGFKPNETVFAFDDEIKTTSENGKSRLSTVVYQIETDATGAPKHLKELSVDYDVIFRQSPSGEFSIVYKLSPTSRDAVAERGFNSGFPQEFSEEIDPRDPGLKRDSINNTVSMAPSLLRNLSFPPQHTARDAHLARYALEGNGMDNTGVMPSPQDILDQSRGQTTQKPVSNQNNNPDPRPTQKPAPDFNRTSTARPPVLEKPRISDSAIEAVIRQYCEDLSARAANGRLDPVVGRDEETQDSIKILSRRKQASLCFTGEAGVGKTAMFSAIAQYIADDQDVPDSLRGARVLQLDLQAMNAGAKYRGEFEAKLKPLIEGLKEREGYLNGRKVILAIDEIHSQLTAGKAEGGTDAGNMMKPFLTSKGIAVMGTTTLEEYRKHIEKDGALASRFEQKNLGEPDRDATLIILNKLWPLIKAHHNMAEDLAQEDMEYLVNMTNRYAPNESQPRKGEKALDMAAASAKFRGSNVIEKEDMIAAVAQMSKLSADFLNQSDHERFLQMEKELPQRVLGQPGIQTVVDGLIGSRSGLNDPNQPWGCFVLQGPTGTGKTELCKELGRYLFGDEKSVIKLDMSEYMEKHSVSRLIGAPPGYVGHDSTEPALTERIRQRPYSILLLDEIEKAHVDVFNVFLSILNDGKMTDQQGKTVLFNNVIIVMTTNLGASDAMAALQGGGSNGLQLGQSTLEKSPEEQQEILSKIYERARKSFFSRPEMVNRIEELGGFVTFIPLAPEVITKLVDRQVDLVSKRISDPTGADIKGVSLELSPEVKAQLAKDGYKPDMGARPLRKAIREKIANPLGKWLMGNKEELAKFAAANGGAKLVINAMGADFKPEIKPVKEPALIAAPAANDDTGKKTRKPRKSAGKDFNA
ncbi:MAG: ATP-dependent Clp protease ATP-binding subunit [Alphaproteobacteria bacterium]|nr:ATP-dependent Clp protease ATP-binding subunit [Alphaproteobacteria bacterium]